MDLNWTTKGQYTWLQRFCIDTIKTGLVPRHIAFIMDGNRRYARKNNISVTEGNRSGANCFKNIIRLCMDLGISEITAYAFSIENFSRSQQEICPLMQMGTEVLKRLLSDDLDNVIAGQVKIRIFGDLDLLEPDIRKLCADLMNVTKNHNKTIINIACAYSSRREITQAVKDILEGVENGMISEKDVDEVLVTKCLYYNEISEPDIVVRSSGVVRLSSFMLWQITSTQLYFVKTLWPDFGIWPLLAVIFMYQHNYKALEGFKDSKEVRDGKNMKNNVVEFLKHLKDRRMKVLESYLLL